MSSAANPNVAPVAPGDAAPAPASPVGHIFTVEVKVRLQALAIPEADGRYSVIVPALPGCVTQGNTIEEVQANLVEAAEGWLDCQHDRHRDERLRGASGAGE